MIALTVTLTVTLTVALAVVLTAPAGVWAADPEAVSRIDPVTVDVHADRWVVTATLAGGIPERILTQIAQGVPKDLFYTVALMRRHRRFFDEEMQTRNLRYTVTYDTLAERFHVRTQLDDGEPTMELVTTLAALVARISRVDPVALAVPPQADERTHYVRVKAEMRAVKLPLYLDYVLFFIPVLEFETPWARSEDVAGVP